MSELQKFMAEVLICEPGALPPESTPLRDIKGWDSLKHVHLVLGLEKKLNEQLTAEEIMGMLTIADVARIFTAEASMSDRAVLVTGVAGEIGGCLVNEFIRDGWIVCGLDQRPPADVDRMGFSFQKCDLSDSAETERKIKVFHEQIGAFSAVVNCAGLIANSPLISFVEGRLVHHDFGLWDRVLSSCLSSAFYVTACTAPEMCAGGKGVIINISSICSHGNPGQAAYSAAKAGLNGLTMALAKELGPMGIRVVALSPGYFDTASTRDHVPAAKLQEIKGAVPLKRLGKLQELTSAVRFILANEYVNGTVIELNGGLVL